MKISYILLFMLGAALAPCGFFYGERRLFTAGMFFMAFAFAVAIEPPEGVRG